MSGYDGFHKSNNAIEAESEGKFPAGIIAKRLKVPLQSIKKVLMPIEWHHTSSYYRKTNYYSFAEAEERIEELKNWKNPQKPTIDEDCVVNWLEWSGSRLHPKCKKRQAHNCKVEYNGMSTYKITFEDGKTMIKRKGTRGFSFI